MAERRTGSSSGVRGTPISGPSPPKPSTAAGSGVADPHAYIKALEERNRAMKVAQSRGKKSQDAVNKRREEGFHVYLSGANEERVQTHRQREKEQPGIKSTKSEAKMKPSAPPAVEGASDPSTGSVSARGPRGKWGAPDRTLYLASERGGPIAVKAPWYAEPNAAAAVDVEARMDVDGEEHSDSEGDEGGDVDAPADEAVDEDPYDDDAFDNYEDEEFEAEPSSGPTTSPSLGASASRSPDAGVDTTIMTAVSASDRSLVFVQQTPTQMQTQAAPTVRPLSAQRRAASASKPIMLSPNSRAAMVQAIASENAAAVSATGASLPPMLPTAEPTITPTVASAAPGLAAPPIVAPAAPTLAPAPAPSNPDVLAALMSRISALAPRQQQFLFDLLQQVEGPGAAPPSLASMSASLGDPSVWRVVAMGLATLQTAPQTPRARSPSPPPPPTPPTPPVHPAAAAQGKPATPAASPPATPGRRTVPGSAASSPRAQPDCATISILLVSTYGSSTMVGLTAIEVFDAGGNPIILRPQALSLAGAGAPPRNSKPFKDLCNLIDGHAKTTNDKHMWTCPLPSPEAVVLQGPLQLQAFVPRAHRPAQLRIWNYNKSVMMSALGVKDVCVLMDGAQVWQGVIKKGSGNKYFDSSTLIPLIDPADCIPPPIVPSSEAGELTARSPLTLPERTASAPQGMSATTPVRPSPAASPVPVPASAVAALAASPVPAPAPAVAALAASPVPAPAPAVAALAASPVPAPAPAASPTPAPAPAATPTIARPTPSPSPKVPKAFVMPPALTAPQDPGRAITPPRGGTSDSPDPEWTLNLPSTAEMRSALALGGANMDTGGKAAGPLRASASALPSPHQPTGDPHVPVWLQDGPKVPRASVGASSSGLPSPAPASRTAVRGRRASGSPVSMESSIAQVQQPAPMVPAPSSQSLQSSWDSLAFFQRNHRGRLDASFGGGDAAVRTSMSNVPAAVPTPAPAPPAATAAGGGYVPSIAAGEPVRRRSITLQSSARALVATPKDPMEPSNSAISVAAAGPVTDVVAQAELDALLAETDGPARDGRRLVSFSSVVESDESSGEELDRTAPVHAPTTPRYADETADSLDMSSFMEDSTVSIPILPQGKTLSIFVKSTWGDPHYVGLAGIDMFDSGGRPVRFADYKAAISAIPSDVNVLPGYGGDPRVVSNLLDGVSHTRDDLHVWLAPFEANTGALVTIKFDEPLALSMVRIWNYNKSRIHSYRGARRICMKLDDKLIFDGEIRKAPGTDADPVDCSEIVLFTQDPAVLRAIEQQDPTVTSGIDNTARVVESVRRTVVAHRPATPGGTTAGMLRRAAKAPAPDLSFTQALSAYLDPEQLMAELEKRPTTAAAIRPPVIAPPVEADAGRAIGGVVAVAELPVGQVLTLRLLDTWGDIHYAGLTGLAVLVTDPSGRIVPYPLQRRHLSADPQDINGPGLADGDPRTLDKLVDGCNMTCDDTHMWLIPYTPGEDHTLTIDLGMCMPIAGIVVWNYNKTEEDSRRGFRLVTLALDDIPIGDDAVYIRKAPGSTHFDFGQCIWFQGHQLLHAASYARSRPAGAPRIGSYVSPQVAQDFETPLFPVGCVLRFVFYSSLGDPYYLGLNGIELFDAAGERVNVPRSAVFAVPDSVTSINGGGPADARVPGNLVAPCKARWDDRNAWLAPLAHSLWPGTPNVVYIVLAEPCCLSMVRIWNYSKKPERGADSVELWLDGILVYSGGLKAAPNPPAHYLAPEDPMTPDGSPEFFQSIVFTPDPAIVLRAKPHIMYCGESEQDVLCINQRQVMQGSAAMQRVTPTAFGVVVDLQRRPATSLVRSS